MKIKDLKIDCLIGLKVQIPSNIVTRILPYGLADYKPKEQTLKNITGEMYIYAFWITALYSGVYLKKEWNDELYYPLVINKEEIYELVIVDPNPHPDAYKHIQKIKDRENNK